RNLRSIFSMGIGLVLFTTFIVGTLFKWLFPELPWSLAFTFGAIVSPPDAVAATSILKRFSINPRLVAVLEGESLINDATGLLLYKMSLVALLSGAFSLIDAGEQFVSIAVGGVVIGMITGFTLHLFSRLF